MSQNITLLGASYTDVPSVQLPKTGGGLASFDDTTDADAVASDIAQGKTAYVNGVKVVGTSQGGGSGTTRYITLYDNSATITDDPDVDYIWINNQPEPITVGDRYRVTWDNTVYIVTAVNDPTIGSQYGNTFGNSSILGGATDPSNAPFCAFKSSWSDNEMIVSTTASGTISLKIEKIVYGDNLTLQSKTITTNGTYTSDSGYDALDQVVVNVSGASKNVQIAQGVDRVSMTTYIPVSGQTLTVAETGTYDVYWSGYRSSTSGTNGSQLYIDDTAYGSANTTFSNNGQSVHLSNVSLTKNQVIAVRARSRSTSSWMYVSNLTIIQN